MKTSFFVFSGFIAGLFMFYQPDCFPSILFLTTDGTNSMDSSGKAKPYQIIISEIMADPEPEVMLPAEEYLELYNRGDLTVDLAGWKIVVGGNTCRLPSFVFAPGEYLILCRASAAEQFSVYGSTLALSSMPALNNSGQTVTLLTPEGGVMHTVTYSPRWYTSEFKTAGGWSLEIIDPGNPCGRSANWRESDDYHGGTPGSPNSVNAGNPDILPPALIRATMAGDSSVRLHFSESMDSSSLMNRQLYFASHGCQHPAIVDPDGPDYISAVLHYPWPFETNRTYTLSTSDSLKDCCGNHMAENMSALFAIPAQVDSFDVVLNEIMFYPEGGKSEYIELYNRSNKVLDLAGLSFALAEPYSGTFMKLFSMKNHPFLLFPGSYAVITGDKAGLPGRCVTQYFSTIIEDPLFFSLPNDEGVILLLDSRMKTLDKLNYSARMHVELLVSTQGVSLERIVPDAPTNDFNNWHSASASSGFSTPGEQNSQFLRFDNQPEDIYIQPLVFSPDNDGCEDFATICYKFSNPGNRANVVIFNAQGRKIISLAENLILGTEGQLIWDGFGDDQKLADIGPYVVYAEIVTTAGKVRKYKMAVILARKIF
jgi:hypothetical protein